MIENVDPLYLVNDLISIEISKSAFVASFHFPFDALRLPFELGRGRPECSENIFVTKCK